MIRDFKKFLLETNALALAIGVIIGVGIGKVVGSLAADVLMPIIGMALPAGNWREQKIVLSTNPDGTVANAINYGTFFGTIVDFIVIAFVVFLIIKSFVKPAPTVAVKTCPACLETIPAAATKCRACATTV